MVDKILGKYQGRERFTCAKACSRGAKESSAGHTGGVNCKLLQKMADKS